MISIIAVIGDILTRYCIGCNRSVTYGGHLTETIFITSISTAIVKQVHTGSPRYSRPLTYGSNNNRQKNDHNHDKPL